MLCGLTLRGAMPLAVILSITGLCLRLAVSRASPLAGLLADQADPAVLALVLLLADPQTVDLILLSPGPPSSHLGEMTRIMRRRWRA